MDGQMRIKFTRAQGGAREVGLVGCVREVLCFQTKSVVLLIDAAGFPGQCAVQKITGVELDTGFRGAYLHHTSALGIRDTRGHLELGWSVLAQHIIVVISSRITGQVRDPVSYAHWLPEIKR